MARGRKARAVSSKPIKRKDQSHDIKLNDEEPDPDNDEFFYDEVDKFHKDKEKEFLLEDDSEYSFDEENEEEVLGYLDEEDDDVDDNIDDDNSDLEDDEAQYKDGIPSSKAWGRKKSSYYGAESLEGLQGLDRDEVQDEEEEEALKIQQRLMEEIDEDQLDMFSMQPTQIDAERKAEKSTEGISTDVSQLSVKAQWKLLKQESPELKDIINDFKDKSAEMTTHLQPLVELVQRDIIKGKGADYITCRYKLSLMYLMNISFYMALKSKRISVRNHPVIKRLVEYRTLINRLQPLDSKLSSEIEELLLENNTIQSNSESEDESKSETEDSEQPSSEEETSLKTAHRLNAINYYTSLHKKRKLDPTAVQEQNSKRDEEDEKETVDDDEEERRAISYAMNKNEGLKGKKRKLDRNPRVKHRERFRKAAIKRKSQVRVHKPELQKYSGEVSGIRAGLVRSVRIK